MQKLVIRETFLGVKPCEIEFDRFLLLIGEQASGKSTIAKLIYFFQSVPELLYKNAIQIKQSKIPFEIDDIYQVIGRHFISIFGSNFNNPFQITFLYNDNSQISIYKVQENSIIAISSSITERTFLQPFQRYNIRFSENEDNHKRELFTTLHKYFNVNTNNISYLIAGRNNVVAYSEYFENKINYDNEKILEEEVKGQDLHKRLRSGNEKLLVDFVKWSSDIRKFFQINGGSFDNIRFNLENQQNLITFEKIFSKILKAEYRHTSNGELLKINDKESVYMKDASSGQQEVLRILQGLYLSVGLKNRKEFFVVEEPEAHLYPLAQKELINAFALFLNTIKEGRLIITTHSPYILACVNILLYANFVSKEAATAQKEIENAVPKDFWLDSKMFNAYSLGHEDTYCQNIKDDETGLIDQNYLDAISEQLGLQYHQLYNLLAENYV